ncbi:hypothetical protein J4216_02305 [Candidatus Woesearchaeota archaeon]|nr:hypothetical protein [Candidatus Woesearchaeota archaeon]
MKQLLLFGGEEDLVFRTLENLDILFVGLDLIGDRVKKQTSGSNYKGLCIFHDEKEPSFYLKPKSNLYICYGCTRRGGPLDLVFRVAADPIRYLERRLGLDFTKLDDQILLRSVISQEEERLRIQIPYI